MTNGQNCWCTVSLAYRAKKVKNKWMKSESYDNDGKKDGEN